MFAFNLGFSCKSKKAQEYFDLAKEKSSSHKTLK